jgi:NAD(P)-dependent dehydrogenase (short-subunit alcohol dehydrogenase family)
VTIEENTMRGVQNKVAIVAGGAPGNIGGATAIRLAQEGMKVVVADLEAAAAQAVVDDIKSAGGYAVARGFDITDESAYKSLIDFTASELGGVRMSNSMRSRCSARRCWVGAVNRRTMANVGRSWRATRART